MHKRFDKLNLFLMKPMQALSPQSTVFLDLIPFLGHYYLPSDEVKVEVLTADKTLKNFQFL